MAIDSPLADRLLPFAHLVVQARAKSDGRPHLYVGRGQGRRGRFGNKNVMENPSDVERWRVIEAHWLDVQRMDPAEREPLLDEIRAHLAAGGALACWCSPKPCHGLVWCWWALEGPAA